MIQKIENPIDELEKELKQQKDKLDRIECAYVNGVFSLEEYDNEKKVINKNISDLEIKLSDTEVCDDLKFTPEDILVKRDIDFINQINYPEKYKELNKSWKEYSREEQANLIMNYIDEIELEKNNNKYEVKFIKFRDSIYKSMLELERSMGYLDKKVQIFGKFAGYLRFSNYLPAEKINEHILRLRQFYDVKFYEACYFTEDQVFSFDIDEDNSTIVRVFPMEDYKKIDPNNEKEIHNYGVLYISKNNNFYKASDEFVFDYIPEKCEALIFSKEPIPIEVKPTNYNTFYIGF